MNQDGERPYLMIESGFIVAVMRISGSSRTDRLVYVCLCNTAAVTDTQPPVSQHSSEVRGREAQFRSVPQESDRTGGSAFVCS